MFWFRRTTAPADAAPPATPPSEPERCPECQMPLIGAPRFARYRVCDHCGFHARRTARQTIAQLTDQASFRELDARLVSTDPLAFQDDQPYSDRLAEVQRRTGELDALVTGTATLAGHPIVIGVLDFSFMGGTMGVVVGEKVARACDRARHDRRPLLLVSASGGARMQEGMFSLLQMAKTTAAVTQLREAGVPFISLLTNPTTGGVFASFGSLGDVIIAEPAALIGFAGPRVAAEIMGEPLPPGTHRAEFLLEHGLIDAIVPRPQLRGYLSALLDVFAASRDGYPEAGRAARPESTPERNAWLQVQAARQPTRPTSVSYIQLMLDSFVELRGDRHGGDDPAVITGLGMLAGHGIALIAQERGSPDDPIDRRQGRTYPQGFRKARRVMSLAARLGLPLVTLIDTPGAYPGLAAEAGGLASEIAQSMAAMTTLPVPTVATVIGEGGSGGALALAIADRVLMQQRAVYTVIAPEAAATILYRDPSRAEEVAARLKLTAADLAALRIIDAVVPEPPGGADANPEAAAAELRRELLRMLAELTRRSPERLIADRIKRYRAIGSDFAREGRETPAAGGSHEARQVNGYRAAIAPGTGR